MNQWTNTMKENSIIKYIEDKFKFLYFSQQNDNP